MSLPAPAPAVAPVSLATIREAARLLAGVSVRTPMVHVASDLARRTPDGGPLAGLFLKCEHLQPIGAFKVRGAHAAISRLGAERRARGVVTSSSGNHGQAVAWVARRFGIRSVVVMPESAPAVKVAGVQRHGGEVVFAGATRSPEQQRRAEQLADQDGLAFIPPFDHPDVISGQGTAGLEILEQLPDVRSVLVPVGGGGLLAGITTAIRAQRPEVEMIGVEPAGAAKLSAALAAGAPTTLAETASLADGLLTRAIGALPWSLIAGAVSRAVQVTEEEIRLAVRVLFEAQGLRVEPSGAVTVAAVLSGRVRPPEPAVLVLSGGNVDQALFEQLVAG
ncbi:MAG TPA: threonine/serine dehydratase [Gemmatimonadales bacterium]|nr:threonine/serine dehydratase [Gemmatimonadales bacterium]